MCISYVQFYEKSMNVLDTGCSIQSWRVVGNYINGLLKTIDKLDRWPL